MESARLFFLYFVAVCENKPTLFCYHFLKSVVVFVPYFSRSTNCFGLKALKHSDDNDENESEEDLTRGPVSHGCSSSSEHTKIFRLIKYQMPEEYFFFRSLLTSPWFRFWPRSRFPHTSCLSLSLITFN